MAIKLNLQMVLLDLVAPYGSGGNGDYPRSTDYASDRWLQVFDCTTNTFTVQVLDSIPSTDLSPHTYVSAVSNSVKFAVSTVRIANESLQFSCPYNGGGTASYPRATDPIGTQGKMKDVPSRSSWIITITSTITVNALNGTCTLQILIHIHGLVYQHINSNQQILLTHLLQVRWY